MRNINCGSCGKNIPVKYDFIVNVFCLSCNNWTNINEKKEPKMKYEEYKKLRRDKMTKEQWLEARKKGYFKKDHEEYIEKRRDLEQKQLRKDKRKDKKMVVEMTEKQKTVVEILHKDINMPTKDVMKEYEEYYEGRDTVSKRHVQRIRKWYKNYLESRKEDPDEVWGFDSKKGDEMSENAISEWEIEVVNYANEGNWSVQEIAQASSFKISVEDVRKALVNHKDLIFSGVGVLDEDNSNVFVGTAEDKETTNMQHKESKKGNGEDTDEWTVELPECIESCGKVPSVMPVYLSATVRRKIKLYMNWAGRNEWLCYLIGKKGKKSVKVFDMVLPDQNASAAYVGDVDLENYNKLSIIGVIHSHHTMGAGTIDKPNFSGIDDDGINLNHDVSLLVATNGKKGYQMTGHVRVLTPCNSFVKLKIKVYELQESKIDERKLKEEFENKIFRGVRDRSNFHFSRNPSITYYPPESENW